MEPRVLTTENSSHMRMRNWGGRCMQWIKQNAADPQVAAVAEMLQVTWLQLVREQAVPGRDGAVSKWLHWAIKGSESHEERQTP